MGLNQAAQSPPANVYAVASASSKQNSITSQIGAITSAYMWAAATPPRRRHEAWKIPSGPAGVRDSVERKFDHNEIVNIDVTST